MAGVIRGVRYRDRAGEHEVEAPLTIGADGRALGDASGARICRRSRRRRRWTSSGSVCRAAPSELTEIGLRLGTGLGLVLLDRGDYWQVAYVIPKGAADRIRHRRSRRDSDKRSSQRRARAAGSRRRNPRLGSGEAADRSRRSTDAMAQAGISGYRRCGARHVARRRRRHQHRDSRRNRCRQHAVAAVVDGNPHGIRISHKVQRRARIRRARDPVISVRACRRASHQADARREQTAVPSVGAARDRCAVPASARPPPASRRVRRAPAARPESRRVRVTASRHSGRPRVATSARSVRFLHRPRPRSSA